jgi:hypothetical protein
VVDSLNISFKKMVVVGGCWHPKDFLVTSWLNPQTKPPFWSSGMADVQLRLWYKHPIPHPQNMVVPTVYRTFSGADVFID